LRLAPGWLRAEPRGQLRDFGVGLGVEVRTEAGGMKVGMANRPGAIPDCLEGSHEPSGDT
jgi:hypothetical protein